MPKFNKFLFVNVRLRMGASPQQPGYLYLGAQSMRSEVRLIFISCVASESSRQRAFEDRRTLRGGWSSVGRGSDRTDPQKIHENVFRGKVTLDETAWDRGSRTGVGGGWFFFLLSTLPACLSCPPMCTIFLAVHHCVSWEREKNTYIKNRKTVAC